MGRPIKAPLVNVNDTEVKLVSWRVEPRTRVAAGQAICEVETTKANVEVEAETEGFVFPAIEVGAVVRVGAPLGWLLAQDDPEAAAKLTAPAAEGDGGLVISSKAREAMLRYGFSAADFAGFAALKESDVEAKAQALGKGDFADDPRVETLAITDRSIVVYGTGSQGDTVLDAIEAGLPYEVVAFIDYAPRGPEHAGLPVLHVRWLKRLYERGLRKAHVCLPDYRQDAAAFAELAQLGFELPAIIHPTASVAPRATIGANAFMGALTIVGPEARLGERARVLNGASVAHHASVGDGSRISDGARLAGNVTVGRDCLIGLNATVNLRLKVGDRATVVSGANVYADVPPDSVVRADGRIHTRS